MTSQCILDIVTTLIDTRCNYQIERRTIDQRYNSRETVIYVSFYKLFLPFLNFPLLKDIQKKIFLILFLMELSNQYVVDSYYTYSKIGLSYTHIRCHDDSFSSQENSLENFIIIPWIKRKILETLEWNLMKCGLDAYKSALLTKQLMGRCLDFSQPNTSK